MDGSGSDLLVETSHVVRRVLGARTNDHHLVEDLTQETIVKVAGRVDRLDPDALRAYAIVTARNLLASHARRESVRGRHSYRLVDYSQLEGPEHALLEREETEALAEALEHLEPGDRELLVRHEAEGVDLATIAADTGSTRGAVAMRLARARAALRLEFLLAFRNVDRPPAACRAVLLALSAGDRRRQAALDASSHLVRCPTCAALAQPMTERNRRIAGWLLLPLAEATRRAWRAARAHPATVAVAATILAASIGVVVLRPDREPPTAADPATAATAPASAPATAPATTPATAGTPPSTGAPVQGPACPPPAPLDEIPADTTAGCEFTATAVTAVAVPSDEGFWATTIDRQAVWVRLIGRGESPVQVEPGLRLVVAGSLVSPSEIPAGRPPGAAGAAPPLHVEVAFRQLSPAD